MFTCQGPELLSHLLVSQPPAQNLHHALLGHVEDPEVAEPADVSGFIVNSHVNLSLKRHVHTFAAGSSLTSLKTSPWKRY